MLPETLLREGMRREWSKRKQRINPLFVAKFENVAAML